ncbi:Golgi transport complex subunit 1 [Rhizophlyctis rosea]|nr:Golgi transport complex subunit 1 [Rhizophlyctis rosea]
MSDSLPPSRRSSAVASAPVPDADTLLEKHSIPELRGMETKIKADIDRKKQDLRLMVGERYRDLIEAADSIRSMKDSSLSVRLNFDHIQSKCAVDALKKEAEEETQKGKNDAAEKQKQLLYPVAAQIKLLVDTPEQIWHALENHQYLRASRLYLLAKKVFGNLQVSPEAASLKLMTSFPVVKRQWDAVGHFRSQIVQKAMRHLRVVDQSEINLTETICAIMLLDNVTPRQALQKFLDMRKRALLEMLAASRNTNGEALSDAFCKLARMLATTIRHLVNIFINSAPTLVADSEPAPSILTFYVQSISRKPSATDTPSSRTSIMPNSELFTEKTNFHVASRHLPEKIQNFSPTFSIKPNEAEIGLDIVQQTNASWLDDLLHQLRTTASSLLKMIQSGKALSEIQQRVTDTLGEIESGKLTAHEPGKSELWPAESWEHICKTAFSRSFSIWENLLRDLFNVQSKAVINGSFGRLFKQSLAKIEEQLSSDAEGMDVEVVGAFMWSISNISTAFEESLLKFRDDIRPLLISHAVSSSDRPVYENVGGVSALDDRDAQLRAADFKDLSVKALNDFSEDLKRSLSSLASQSLEKMVNQSVFIGRSARAIALKLEDQSSILLLDETVSQATTPSLYREASQRFLLSPRNSETHLADPRLTSAKTMLMDVYLAAHAPWIEYVGTAFEAGLRHSLEEENWREATRLRGAWEVQQSHGSGTAVPTNPSPFILPLLFRVAGEANRVSGCFLEKPALRSLILDMGRRLVDVYSQFAQSATSAVSAVGAMQLFFDVHFWMKIMEGVWDGVEGGDEGAQKQRAVIETALESICAKIDAAQLEALKELNQNNVERSYSRSSVLLGTLLLLNPKVADVRKTPSTQEVHNVIPLATQPPRFTLLPITPATSTKSDRRASVMDRRGSAFDRRPSKVAPDSTTQSPLNPSRRKSSAAHLHNNNTTTPAAIKTLRKPRSIHLLRPGHDTSPQTASTPSLNVMGLVNSVSGLARDIQLGQVQQKTSEVLLNATSFISGVWGAGAASPGPARKQQGRQ